MNQIVAIDFDGVLCNSAPETAISAWKTCRQLFPQYSNLPSIPNKEQIANFVTCRPILETGYQAPIIIHLLLQNITPQQIQQNFHSYCQQFLTNNNYSKQQLITTFGNIRDNWIKKYPQNWLQSQNFYPEALKSFKHQLQNNPQNTYILTTKQERFVTQLLKAQNIIIPKKQLFGLEKNTPKEITLSNLTTKHPNTIIHFIEDRLDTLLRINNTPNLNNIKLYLATWGYNTTKQQQQAKQNPKIKTINEQNFLQNIQT